jgi:hypothetical protein
MEVIFGVVIGILIASVLLGIFVGIFRWLWNITMPEVFGLKEITFWQALRLVILAGILFGSGRVVEQNVGRVPDAGKTPPPQEQPTGK